ncbi:hypothetical protein [Kurthia senegalensis]|uniref:hypothetical protein n=1 Tax=Kurthia senegalensis TaxID=1033740 RepID=UPI000288F16C|nr:hypothetical protein [Kurthia senegalensis]
MMLEHSLRVVEVCLDARKNKKLDHIKSMRGYINHAIEKELTAYVVSQQEKLLPKVSPSTQQKILEIYGNADEKIILCIITRFILSLTFSKLISK